jgi:UDP-N-acetyl-D-glucosamine dehydrogenase
MKFNPGIGVGGHCIPVDPSYLAYSAESVGVTPRFINLANTVNLEMPKAIVERISRELGVGLKGKSVLICGVAYKTNISDTRESPAEILFSELESAGAAVSWHDPLVENWNGSGSQILSRGNFDVSIITVLHDAMNETEIRSSAKLVFDCTGKVVGLPTL